MKARFEDKIVLWLGSIGASGTGLSKKTFEQGTQIKAWIGRMNAGARMPVEIVEISLWNTNPMEPRSWTLVSGLGELEIALARIFYKEPNGDWNYLGELRGGKKEFLGGENMICLRNWIEEGMMDSGAGKENTNGGE